MNFNSNFKFRIFVNFPQNFIFYGHHLRRQPSMNLRVFLISLFFIFFFISQFVVVASLNLENHFFSFHSFIFFAKRKKKITATTAHVCSVLFQLLHHHFWTQKFHSSHFDATKMPRESFVSFLFSLHTTMRMNSLVSHQ